MAAEWERDWAFDGALTHTTVQPPPGKQTHVQAFRHLLQCIREGRRQTDSPGERAVVVMRIIDAMHRSAGRGGRQVRVGRSQGRCAGAVKPTVLQDGRRS